MDNIKLITHRIDDLKDSVNERLDRIDANLAEHMRRTDVLEQLHRDNQERIQLLEEPRKALLFLKNVLIYVSVTSGAIISILKLLGKI